MAKKFSEYARERRADQSTQGHEVERTFRSAYAFGHAVYSARKARNLRQSDLAELSGIDQADISRIERGQIAPTVQTLLKLADALGAHIQLVLPASDGSEQESKVAKEVFTLSVGV